MFEERNLAKAAKAKIHHDAKVSYTYDPKKDAEPLQTEGKILSEEMKWSEKEEKDVMGSVKASAFKSNKLYGMLVEDDAEFIEVSMKHGLWLRIPSLVRTKLKITEVQVGKETYGIGPGLYLIMGAAESGKSSLVAKLFNGSEFQPLLLLETFFVDNQIPWPIIQSFSSGTDLAAISRQLAVCWANDKIPCFDSFKTLFSFNDKPIMAEGVPVGPFDLLNRIDMVCVKLQRTIVATVPIPSDKESVQEAFYKQAAQQTSGVFLPRAKMGQLRFTLRNCFIRKRRIGTNTISFE